MHTKILPLIHNRYDKKYENLIRDHKNKSILYERYSSSIFKLIMNKLAMKHLPHDGRHTFATLLSNADANPISVKKLIGHTNYELTEDVYIHKSIDELRKAIDRI